MNEASRDARLCEAFNRALRTDDMSKTIAEECCVSKGVVSKMRSLHRDLASDLWQGCELTEQLLADGWLKVRCQDYQLPPKRMSRWRWFWECLRNPI